MAFQTAVGTTMAPGIEGGWSGRNPHFTLTNPDEAQWIVGAAGAIIGRFGWANPINGQVTSVHPGVASARVGFIHRDQEVFITGLLNAASLALVSGQPIDLLEDGPVWGRFAAGSATVGLKVYASYADGSLRAAVTGAPATATGVTVSMNNSPNITAVAGGTLVPGQPVSGAGIPANTFVVSVSGTTAVLSAATTGGAATGVAVTQTLDFETAWLTRSICLSGEVAKLSVRG